MSRRLGEDSERGVVLVLVAASLVVLLLIAALVLDVGYAYAVGRQEQTVADLTALAAALELPGDPVAACDTGWAYINANLPGLPGSASMPCSTFPTSCDDTTAVAEYTATSTGGFTITFHYPVPDTDPLMASQPIAEPADGYDPCGRLGVTISHDDTSFFSGIAGIGDLYPHVKAVARQGTGGPPHDVANLVSLDPTGCVGIESKGSTNLNTITDIVVASYVPGPGQSAIPGAIAVDSNGTACTGGQTTIDATGGSKLYAEPTTGLEIGQISLKAMPGDQTTCTRTATNDCDQSQVPSNIAPQPISSRSRVTRAPADHVYNCKSTYGWYNGTAGSPNAIQIAGCDTSNPKNGGAYIDQFTAAIQADITNNTPPDSSWNVFPTCKPSSNGTYVGNWWVDCPSGQGFQLGNGTQITFEGNVIFNGNVNQSGGELDFEGEPVSSGGSIPAQCRPPSLQGTQGANAADCLDYSISNGSSSASTLFTDTNGHTQQNCSIGSGSPGTLSPYSPPTFSLYSPPPDCASFVYLNGSMTPSGSYTLNFNGTSVYVAASSQSASNFSCNGKNGGNSLTSNGGIANWIAPTDGLFNNLSLWSESVSGFGFHGGGNTVVDGVFFTPCSQFTISGNFLNPQTAQFLTYQLKVVGGSQLTMLPVPNRQLPTASSGSMLIR